jgi:hypothetical protein
MVSAGCRLKKNPPDGNRGEQLKTLAIVVPARIPGADGASSERTNIKNMRRNAGWQQIFSRVFSRLKKY